MIEKTKAAPAVGIAACIAAVVAISAPMATAFEGEVLHPYRDPANIVTWCDGETQGVPKDHYTSAECATMLRARQARDYAPPVLRCVPLLAQERRRPIFAASIDFAYNGGVAAFCRSSMARAFNAGRWAAGCDAFRLYYKARIAGRLTVLRGLARRRAAERTLCLKGS
jgi:lysozyme